MAFKNKQLLIRYVSGDTPKIFTYLLETNKKETNILSTNMQTLESYQHEKGLITDNQVLGDKIIHSVEGLDKQVKDSIIFLYDMPNQIKFSTIVPKTSTTKALNLAKKELEDFFKGDANMYHFSASSVLTPEKGIIYYFDLITNQILKDFDELALAMDRYIDSHASYKQAIASTFEVYKKDKTDTFLIYQDESVTHILLLIESKLVDSLSYYHKQDLKQIVSSLEILRNKHTFSFERKDINNVCIITHEDKTMLEKSLKETYHFDVINLEITLDDMIKHAVNNINSFKDGFHIKV